MPDQVHLVKLSVGTESVDTLADWQAMRATQMPDGLPRHVTRMWPRREKELLNGGSIFWVIKGQIQARQRVVRLDKVEGEDGKDYCAIVLDPELVRTSVVPRRPFQGWRYLAVEDAPVDLPKGRATEEPLPRELAEALADIGVL